MKLSKAVLIVLTGILVIALSFPPAMEGKAAASGGNNQAPAIVKLNVNNKVGQTFILTLTGPTTYSWNVPMGKSTYDIQQGKYKYTYQACGGTKTGTVVVKKTGHTLTLAACKRQGQSGGGTGLAKVTINNNTGGYVTLQLTGKVTYNFNLAPGKSIIQVERGKYSYTAWGCGGASISGIKNLRNGLVWKFWCSG